MCDWLSELLLPDLTAKIKSSGYKNLLDFLNHLNRTNLADTTTTSTNNTNNSSEKQRILNSNNCNGFILSYTSDIYSYLNVCNQIETNIVYLEWLFDFFKPLVSTLFLTLFLLPSLVVIFIYASSFYCYLSKHWIKLKVS